MKIYSAEYVVPVSSEPIFDGAIAVEDGEIVDVGTEKDLIARYPNAEHENFPHHAIMPGLINAHTHFDMSLYKDYDSDPVRKSGVRVNYVDWLLGCFEYKRKADHAHLREAVSWAVDEVISSGTTCVGDMGNYEGIFSILEQKGLRAVVFPEVLSFDVNVSKDLFESALALVEKYSEEDSSLITVGIGPYSPFTLSRNILRIVSLYGKTSDMPIMIHAAASFSEMEFFHDSTGDIAAKLFPTVGWDELPPPHQRTPIQHLKQIGFLDAKPILVGCVQTTDTDIENIAESGAKIVITPRAAHYLQQGQADYARLRAKNTIIALGTGGIPSVDSLSLWDEVRMFLETYQHKMTITGREVLELVTLNAAKVLGVANEVGSLEKGKSADLLIVNIANVPTAGDFELNLMKRTRGSQVERVMISGKTVKSVN